MFTAKVLTESAGERTGERVSKNTQSVTLVFWVHIESGFDGILPKEISRASQGKRETSDKSTLPKAIRILSFKFYVPLNDIGALYVRIEQKSSLG